MFKAMPPDRHIHGSHPFSHKMIDLIRGAGRTINPESELPFTSSCDISAKPRFFNLLPEGKKLAVIGKFIPTWCGCDQDKPINHIWVLENKVNHGDATSRTPHQKSMKDAKEGKQTVEVLH